MYKPEVLKLTSLDQLAMFEMVEIFLRDTCIELFVLHFCNSLHGFSLILINVIVKIVVLLSKSCDKIKHKTILYSSDDH